ncbi:hypothetical protein [Agrobacterium tumefaciens]|uniref:hypothetical protein n=1 Tax=Agrobacterium tumefaciens TaxID=358 RepID=UPI000EF2CF4F|nr:hypothetical protein [Agrobacterium tumefaciens]AYM08983.1 hypothetical protein At1D1460_47420 [Agrobacterium tumefaciens]QLG25424.1 hypothetical protein EML4_23905 [Agrobacterium tumefaciens]
MELAYCIPSTEAAIKIADSKKLKLTPGKAVKRESVTLSECKILCHVRNLRPERADPARWLLKGPGTVAIIAMAKPSDGSLLADPEG